MSGEHGMPGEQGMSREGGPVLRVRSLSKAFGASTVLEDVHLCIDSGEIVSLLGANGAGKTTLIGLVAGLLEPDGGSIEIHGVDGGGGRSAARGSIGVAPQELGIYPTLTVRENIDFFARLAGVRRRSRSEAVDAVIAELQLDSFVDVRAGVLSGGQKRRLHTALALVGDPKLIFLDEPTVGADVESRESVLDAVIARGRAGAAVCYTTHYLAEVERLGGTLAILHHGRISHRGAVPTASGGVERLFRACTSDTASV